MLRINSIKLAFNGLLCKVTFFCSLGEEKSRLDTEVEDVNKRRKLKHTAAGKELGEMHKEWRALLSKNSDIAKACSSLDAETADLQAQLQE